MKSWLLSRLRSAHGKLANRLLPSTVVFGLNRNDRTGALHRAWGHVFSSQIRGAYYELGVYHGDTFRESFSVYQEYNNWLQSQLSAAEPWRQTMASEYARYQHHFYAFDTFQGMPPNDEENVVFAEGSFFCSLEDFARRNRDANISEGDRVKYFKGTFSEVLNQRAQDIEEIQPAAIINLDCDLYSSACDALALVTRKLIQGTVLLADDWNTFAASGKSGERKAVNEWLSSHKEIRLEPWFPYYYTGQAFLVHLDD